MQASMETPALAYSPADAARMLGMSKSRLYQLMDEGRIGSLKIGRLRRLRHEHLVAFLDSCEQHAA